jgi:hypothetical protein
MDARSMPMPKANGNRRAQSARKLANALGLFSIGLGLTEFMAARGLGRTLGVRRPGLWRSYGVREIGTGIGILASRNPEPWIWARVAGDALDLASLTKGLRGRHARPLSALGAIATVATVTFVDYYCAKDLYASGRNKVPVRDYSGRRGFPNPAEQMRGAALARGQSKVGERARSDDAPKTGA